jgi:hypothetical protein
MRRRAALVGSIALHVALGALVLSISRDARQPEPSKPTSIELVDIVEVQPPKPASHGGGGSPGASAAAQPRVASSIHRDGDSARTVTASLDKRGTDRRERSLTASLSSLATASTESGDGGDGGDGGGRGGGHGRGIGLGDGPGIETLDQIPAPPPPPAAEVAISKARPARLIYPTRNREVSDAELFVARVIVDHDGYVVGARIVRGFGGHRDEQASNLIWRFRYEPALDDAGRAITSTLDQRFLVQ